MTLESDKNLESHFEFGENWADYAKRIDDSRIERAEQGMLALLSQAELQSAQFLDIGCGSGLHSLAALNLGVASVRAFDIDPSSVATTRAVLAEHSARDVYQITEGDTSGSWDLAALCTDHGACNNGGNPAALFSL